MAIKYEKASDDVFKVLHEAISKYRTDLVQAGFAVAIRTAFDPDGGPAIKLRGHACAATIKHIASKDRLFWQCDALIDIDEAVWDSLSDAQRMALFDHELHHIELRMDRNEKIKRDANGRPKWRNIPHDYELGGFADMLRRHKANSMEVLCVKAAARRCDQLLLALAEEKK